MNRDELIQALRFRISQVSAPYRTAEGVLDPAGLVEAAELARTAGPDDRDVFSTLGMYHWIRYRLLPADEAEPDRSAAVRWYARIFPASPHDVPTDLYAWVAPMAEPNGDAPEDWSNEAADLMSDPRTSSHPQVVARAVSLLERTVAAVAPDHPYRGEYLANLCMSARSLFERTGDRDAVDRAVAAGRASLGLAATPDVRARFLSNLVHALQLRYEAGDAPADLEEALQAAREAVALTSGAGPVQAVPLVRLSGVLQQRFLLRHEPADVDEAVDTAERAVQAASAEDPRIIDYLTNLSRAMARRFAETHDQEDIDTAADLTALIIETAHADDAARADLLANRAMILHGRFEDSHDPADIAEAVDLYRETLTLVALGEPKAADYLRGLGTCLRERARYGGGHAGDDVDESLHVWRLLVDEDRTDEHLLQLGLTLYEAFERTDDADRLAEAIDVLREATAGAAPELGALGLLAGALGERFRRTGLAEDRQAGLAAAHRAVELAGPDSRRRADALDSLSICLRYVFGRAGDAADIDAAVLASREAVALAPERATYLSHLSLSLSMRFGRTGDLADIDAAVEAGRRAVAAVGARDFRRAGHLTNLCTALAMRHDQRGGLPDLDEAVSAARAAAELTPVDHRDHAIHLHNLGDVLDRRFLQTGASEDLEEAVRAAHQTMVFTARDHPEREARLSVLSSVLLERSEHQGDPDDLDDAILALRLAVESTTPAHPRHRLRLVSLGATLLARYGRTGTGSDLDEAIQLTAAAHGETEASDPNLPMYTGILANCFDFRFMQNRRREDLDEAIRFGREATSTLGEDHPKRAALLYNLGSRLVDRIAAEVHPELKAQDADEAVGAFRAGTRAGGSTPASRVRCGRSWAELAPTVDGWPEAGGAWQEVLELLPLLVQHGLGRADRQRHLGLVSGAAAEAAAAAMELGDTALAWSALEQARGVLLSQALETRTDTAELHQTHPELAAEVDRLRVVLNMSDREDRPAAATRPTRRDAARDWQRLLAEVRERPGFERFALPPTIAELSEAVGDGVVVAVNVARRRSDALVLSRTKATTIPLPGLSYADAADFAARFMSAAHAPTMPAGPHLSAVLAWMWDTIAEPVLDHLGWSAPPRPGDPPRRVWWIPTGPLAALPLHAAGHHDPRQPDSAGRTVLDRVVSSYAPTVRAVHRAARARVDRPGETLVVGIDTVPGHRPLTKAVEEGRLVHRTLRGGPAPLFNEAASRDAVLDALPRTDLAHFACHAAAGEDPADSHLVLHDGPLTVRELSGLQLPTGHLAYLSACTTAFGGVELADESIHIASAFQLAGFRHVVGTLWPIADTVALDFARHIYGGLHRPDDAAHAVHAAVHAVRAAYPAHPQLWASHVHIGP
ncbi:hypothetical protein F4553_001887 [Allocatelliglobosispora scoriae]|uniref:Plant heme peroxidase family profile domain-containing protein n=1 Tax=Allocatelliglobosispora scoriae TaxID=643052 RepID=A0A841BMB7_9ACTN|nr:CHAT domain-containing protein [Allocatelliglobosispora scoriae]MBB5868508.1 hypothetical protein [Allocatelliglobosispora scoriae]